MKKSDDSRRKEQRAAPHTEPQGRQKQSIICSTSNSFMSQSWRLAKLLLLPVSKFKEQTEGEAVSDEQA